MKLDFVRNTDGSIKELPDKDRPGNLFVIAQAEIDGAQRSFCVSAPFPKDYPYEGREQKWLILAEFFVARNTVS